MLEAQVETRMSVSSESDPLPSRKQSANPLEPICPNFPRQNRGDWASDNARNEAVAHRRAQ